MPETRHPSRREQYFSSRPWGDTSTLVSEVSTKRTSASIHIWANGHYHESCVFKPHSSNSDKLSTHVRVMTHLGTSIRLLFRACDWCGLGSVLPFSLSFEVQHRCCIMVASGALLQLEESFRFRWEVVPNTGMHWGDSWGERDLQQILVFIQMIHTNDELSCTLSEASHANRTCC